MAAGSPAIAGRIASSTVEISTTHGVGTDQLTRTEANSHPLHTGDVEAAGAWRPGPKVYAECPFRIKDSSVTSVTVQKAYFGGGGIPPPSRSGTLGHHTVAAPWGGKDSSVTSVTVQRAYLGVGGIQSPSARGRLGETSQPPLGAKQCPAAQRTSSD
jgi:hypothetical protein